MNERIKELALQAGFYVADGKIYIPTTSEEITTCQKKFVELIVQDIINTALFKARWYQQVEKNDNTVMALCDLVKDIREEYGVE